MSASLSQPADRATLQNVALRPAKAKVHTSSLQNLEKVALEQYRIANGKAMRRAVQLSGLTLSQFAGEIKKDVSQVSKWFDATEPPQLDPVLMSPMRPYMLLALAESTDECEVTTEIRLRRRA